MNPETPVKWILRLHPEIIVKGDKVRKKFIHRLYTQLATQLSRLDAQITVKQFWDKIEVDAPLEACQTRLLERLKNTPGIQKIMRVHAIDLGFLDHRAMECAQRVALAQWGRCIEHKSFVVRVKRKGAHAYDSQEMERAVGAYLLAQVPSARVQLKQPDVTLSFEVEERLMWVIEAAYPGLGGFPVGTQAPVLSLLSGGVDSSVASFMAMRRGSPTHFLFFNLGGRAHAMGAKQMAYYLWHLFEPSNRVYFLSVDFGPVVQELLTRVSPPLMGLVLKRQMLRVAHALGGRLGTRALVTGEAVGQVSSQTLPSLAHIDAAIEGLVLRPLIMMDKDEILQHARTIGTEVFSRSMPEYCGVISHNPKVNPTSAEISREEANLDPGLIERAVLECEQTPIEEVLDTLGSLSLLEVTDEATQVCVIDIRPATERAKRPLVEAQLCIPFYELNQRFSGLEPNQTYALYCQKGVLSHLHGQYLRDLGFENVKVYRPRARS
jgi:thiamine biosynthesis protein ThiI